MPQSSKQSHSQALSRELPNQGTPQKQYSDRTFRQICQIAVISCAWIVLTSTVNLRAEESSILFERRIRPLLLAKCVGCHGANKQEGDLRLDSREQVLTGSAEVGALVVPGKPDESRLLQVLLYADDDVQMPPKSKLSAPEIQYVREWIHSGAEWPQDSSFGAAEAVSTDQWRNHWAFQPVTDPPRPNIGTPNWHPIDAFIRARLRTQALEPSPLANGDVLVRRVAYALTGLLPESADLQAVRQLSDSAQVFRFVTDYGDRLLASPQFGERWARYWLDISRYADTKGYVFQEDREYKEAWKFRDWVINSLNADMPYDEFLRRQIAADQLPGKDDPAQLAAMGFLTLGRRFLNNKHDIIDDRIDVLTRGTMALTVTCARCHDHKFDPIPTADYYALYGVFDSSAEPGNEPSSLRLVDLPKPRQPYIFVRGLPGNRGERVTRHFLTALSGEQPKPFSNGSGRLELADRITSADNPLTARVAVNRVWLRLFGRGLVDSVSDFGVRTPPPQHPQLLDHLAAYFQKNNWSRKKLIRYILLSWTWRQSSAPRADAAAVDPENRLLARMPRRRLDFEAFRDSVLRAAGCLDSTVGGPSVDITAQPFTTRRTVYARIDRQNLPGVFRTFDFASPDNHSASRFETTVPQQGLFQFNNPFLLHHASLAADDIPTADTAAAVQSLYERILGRTAAPAEVEAALQFLRDTQAVEPPTLAGAGWHYGWGEFSPEGDRVVQFDPFPVHHKNRWCGGTEMPDERLGWCSLTPQGGHPGSSLRLCSIRRWVADRDCTVRISSQVTHSEKRGDGVYARIVGDGETLADSHVFHSSQRLATRPVQIAAGETIDFVVSCQDNSSFDSYGWTITMEQSVNGRSVRTWRSEQDYSPRQPEPRLRPLEQLAHTLLMTNEFLFVD